MHPPLTQDDCAAIKEGLAKVFPYVGGHLSTLGGPERATVMIVVSFDPKSQWQNGILENSKYARFSIDNLTVTHFGGYKTNKFIKRKFKSVAVTIEKITEWAKE